MRQPHVTENGVNSNTAAAYKSESVSVNLRKTDISAKIAGNRKTAGQMKVTVPTVDVPSNDAKACIRSLGNVR